MSVFRIREAMFPDDREAALSFIMGSQNFEHEFEPDRRLDSAVAEEHFAKLMDEVGRRNGRVFIVEGERRERLGWGVVHEANNEVFVVPEERLFGYISELFVVEAARGMGIGRALIAASEDWARARGLKVMMIATLSGNTRARRIYETAGFSPYAIQLRKYL